MAILYPASLANLVVEVGTRHCHQTLFTENQVIVVPNLLSLAAPQVVAMTICDAVCDGKGWHHNNTFTADRQGPFCSSLRCGDRVNSAYLGQYHGCWCPGSLRHQDINSHDIDYVEYIPQSWSYLRKDSKYIPVANQCGVMAYNW